MKLKEYRECVSYTIEEAAEQLGVAPETVSMYEDGSVAVDDNTLKRLAKLYLCKPSDLLKDDSEPNPRPMGEWCKNYIDILDGNNRQLRQVHTYLKFLAKEEGYEKY